jgi:DNA integrity scanning protein DisA with diadenylate cyclase activity
VDLGIDIKNAIAKTAVQLASETHASAIIVISDDESLRDILKDYLKVDIPIYVARFEGRIEGVHEDLSIDFISKLMGSSTNVSQSMDLKARSRAELLEDAITVAYADGKIKGDLVVGVVGVGVACDSIIIYNVRESPAIQSLNESAKRVDPNVLRAVLRIAMDIGREGREGRYIGTVFVVGDSAEVLKRSHQLILNPFQGHDGTERDITCVDNWESIKALAMLDGAFIVDERGQILTAGAYLDVDAKSVQIQKGLGARHAAAAAISKETRAISVTVSQSGGTVRVYKDGKRLIEIESSIEVKRHA